MICLHALAFLKSQFARVIIITNYSLLITN